MLGSRGATQTPNDKFRCTTRSLSHTHTHTHAHTSHRKNHKHSSVIAGEHKRASSILLQRSLRGATSRERDEMRNCCARLGAVLSGFDFQSATNSDCRRIIFCFGSVTLPERKIKTAKFLIRLSSVVGILQVGNNFSWEIRRKNPK